MLKIIKEYSPNEIEINLAGSFNENNEIIKQYHGINNINFLGFVTHDILAQKYQDADLFVFPTLGEGYGMVVLEALSTGTPVLISNLAGGDDTIETYALGNLPGQTLEDNFWLDTYRDELGINVVYDWIVKGDDEYSQKINITIATGELPDIMSVTATQMVQLAEADLIADISDVYEAYAADFTKETLTQEGDDPFLGIWRGNPRPFNDRDESAACFYHAINLPKA